MRSTSIVGAFVSLFFVACSGGSSVPSTRDVPPAATSPGAETPDSPPAPATRHIGISLPATAVVRAGQSITFEVETTRPADVSGPMTIEVVDLAPGVVAKVSAGAEDTFSVTLETTAESPLGDHHLRVRGSAGGVHGEARLPLVIAGAPGTLDTSFADGGIATKLAGDLGHGLVLDRQGRALVTGLRFDGQKFESRLTRFLPSGAIDVSFGKEGTLKELFVDASMSMAHTTAMLDDGAMIVSGAILTATKENKSCFVKLDAAGKRVPSFGTAGQVCAPASLSMPIRHAVVGPDGSIYAVGTSTDGDGDMAVLKVTKDGVLETSFGVGGRVVLVRAGEQEAVGIAFDSTGRLVVGGNCIDDQTACAWRLDTSGEIDPTYAGGLAKGKVGMLGMEARGMTLGPKDEIYLVGATSTSQMAVVAFDSEGTMLSTFGSGGWITFALTTKDQLFGAAWDDGKLLLVGTGQDVDAAEPQVLALRVGADGQLDPSYANTGFGLHPVSGEAYSVSLSPGRATVLANKDGMQLVRVWR